MNLLSTRSQTAPFPRRAAASFNKTVQRTGASRFAQRRIQRHRRLTPVADLTSDGSTPEHLMKLISYADLSRMHLRDYVPDVSDIEVEESGMIGLVGLGGWERLGGTYFTWRQGEPFQTAGIALDLSPGSSLPQTAANQILRNLGLPVRIGATVPELNSGFGSPPRDKVGQLLRFVCGERERFLVGCVVDDQGPLVSLFIARKDYCDEDDSI